MSAPMVLFLERVAERLMVTNIPVYFALPAAQVSAPFYVIGHHFEDDSKTAKVGRILLDTELQVSLFYPMGNRTAVEEVIYQTRRVLGRFQRVTSSVTIDRSLQHELYHVVFKINEIV